VSIGTLVDEWGAEVEDMVTVEEDMSVAMKRLVGIE
jgi:hypothetical protein